MLPPGINESEIEEERKSLHGDFRPRPTNGRRTRFDRADGFRMLSFKHGPNNSEPWSFHGRKRLNLTGALRRAGKEGAEGGRAGCSLESSESEKARRDGRANIPE